MHTNAPITPKNASVKVNLPYFDYLFERIAQGDEHVANSFGHHVHWGYWQTPKHATLTLSDFQYATEQLSRQVYDTLPLNNGLSIADIGCGFGGTIALLNAQYHEMELIGLNIDSRQLVRAQHHLQSAHGNRIYWIQGNACQLPFADASIDCLLAVECIFHFPSRQAFFREAYRVLKPNGYLALSDFVSTSWLKPFTQLDCFGHFYGRCQLHYTHAMYQMLATQTGFNEQMSRDITHNTLPTYTYLAKLAQQQRLTHPHAKLETTIAATLSHLRLLRYRIYQFQKLSG